ncbi:MAG TPA: hypothetical protein VLH84_01280 [Patescibacteria group bacterium]|nr:hypothetical protein [Patescibacteria group bacterium]
MDVLSPAKGSEWRLGWFVPHDPAVLAAVRLEQPERSLYVAEGGRLVVSSVISKYAPPENPHVSVLDEYAMLIHDTNSEHGTRFSPDWPAAYLFTTLHVAGMLGSFADLEGITEDVLAAIDRPPQTHS